MDNKLIIGALVGLVVISILIGGGHLNLGPQAVFGTETITRTVPTSVNANGNFQVTYNVFGATGTYGFLIDDKITGGCKLSDGSAKYVAIVTNPDTSKTLTVTAPASGSCTFSGTYSIGNISTRNFEPQTITVCSSTTLADTNCDSVTQRSELLNYLQAYIDGSATKANLLIVLQNWINGGGI